MTEDSEAGPGGRRERHVETPDGRLRLVTRGRGTPLVCLHGLSAHAGVFRRVAPLLEDGFALRLPDLLGRGRSEARPELPHTLERELSRAGRIVEDLPDGGYLLLGHSQGAALAVALSAAGEGLPRPGGLVLVAPVTPWTRRPLALGLLRPRAVRRLVARPAARLRRPVTRYVLERRAFGDPHRVDDATVRRYAEPWADPGRAEALLRALADWRPDRLSAHLPADPPPAVVLAGGRDRRIPPDQARRWAARLGAGFRLVPGAGHVVPEERPRAVARAVRRIARRSRLAG